MMSFAKTDDELALIIGHELGHLITRDMSGLNLRDPEVKADYFGMYFAARAGYDFRVAAQLWRRYAAEIISTPESYRAMRTDLAVRAVAARAFAAEIDRKLQRGEPLLF
jgi:predicted Zn-dependent protease